MLPCGHPAYCWMREAPNQSFGLACADPGHSRAALVTGDLRIADVLPQHPIESHGQLPGRRHLGHAFRLAVATRLILFAKSIVQPAHALRRLPHPHLVTQPLQQLNEPLAAARLDPDQCRRLQRAIEPLRLPVAMDQLPFRHLAGLRIENRRLLPTGTKIAS